MFLKIFTILLFFGASSAQDGSLTCTYMYGWMRDYFCILEIDNQGGRDNFTLIFGDHRSGANGTSVVALYGAEARPGTAVNVPSIICTEFPKLIDLWMDGLNINSVSDKALNGCRDLETLYLSQNQISELSSGVFMENSKLKLLDLADNKLTSLPGDIFKNLQDLESLYLDHNQFSTIDDQLFSPLRSLHILWLSSCGLSTLNSTWFNSMEELKVLYIDNNKITDLPSGIFNSMRGLRILKLNDNELASISANAFSTRMDNFTVIHANDNKIDEIHAEFFEISKSLEIVEFERNLCIDMKFSEFSKARDQNLLKFGDCFKNYEDNNPTTPVVVETTTPGGAGASIWGEFLKIIPLLSAAFFIVLKFV